MNALGRGGNPGIVRSSRQITAFALAGLGLLTGCGAARGAGLDGLAPGTLAVRVMNNVATPGELDRIAISIDGETIALSAIPPSGRDVATVARLKLAAGPHSVSVRARARSTGSDVLIVGAQQPFHLGRGPAALTIDVRSIAAPPSESSASPITVSLAILGGRMAPALGAQRAEDRDDRCGALLPIPQAICRAAVDLDEATRKNDIVAALCVRDKLSEMRRLAIVGEGGRGAAVAMAEAEVAALSKQVDLCQASYVAPEPDGLRVLPPPRR